MVALGSRAQRWVSAGGGLTLLLWALGGWASPESSRYVLSHWEVADGLPQTSVTSVAEDDRGFLWLTTFGGLARFDGHRFVRVDLPYGDLDGHRFVSVAAVGSAIWVGSDHGRLFRFGDYGRGAPTEVRLGERPEATVWQLLPTPEGLVVAAGQGGLWRVTAEGEARLVSPLPSTLVARALDGRLWRASDMGAGCVGEGCLEHALRASDTLWVRPNGTVLVAAAEGIFRLEPARLVKESEPARGRVLEGPEGVWAMGPAGLELRKPEGTLGFPLPVREGRARKVPVVRQYYRDSRGAVWVATDDDGLFQVRDRHLQTIDSTAGLRGGSINLALPLPSGGALIAPYCGGLQRLSDDRRVVQPVPGFAEHSCVTALALDGAGGAWVGVAKELFHLQPDGPHPVPVVGGFEANLKVILEDGPGLWAGTLAGLTRLAPTDGGGFEVKERWPGPEVYALAHDRHGGLLVGTLHGALRLRDGRLSALTSPDHRAAVRDFLVDDQGAWVATYGEGLARVTLNEAGATGESWHVASKGFCSDELSRLVPIGDQVWVNSNQGVFVVRLEDLRVMAERGEPPRCRGLDTGEGNGGGQVAGGLADSRAVLFPTVDGVVVIDPEALATPPPAPALYVASATVDTHQLSTQGATHVPFGRRDLSITLMTPPEPDLKPLDPRDVVMTLVRDGEPSAPRLGGLSATYLDLSPGDYVFEAHRPGGPPVRLTFALDRAFAELPAVRFGAPLGAVLLVWVAVRSWRRLREEAARAAKRIGEQAERSQRERDALYHAAFEGSPGPLFLFDAKGTLHDLNHAAASLLGWTEARRAVDGRDLVAADDWAPFLELLAGRAERQGMELTVMVGGDERRRLRVDAAVLEISGQPRVLVAGTDVTAARAAETQRQALITREANVQRLEGLGRLAAGVAHDFNNVLGALALQVRDLRARSDDPATVRALAGEMEEALEVGRDFTSKFLVFGKGAAEPVTFELDKAVRSSGAVLGRVLTAGVALDFDTGAAGLGVRLPRPHLDQLLLNLVLNARQAIGVAGRIGVRTRVDPPEDSSAWVVLPRPEGAVVQLEVKDTGHGMSPQTLSRAFEPFFTTQEQAHGTGLGLSVVHGIAQRAGAGLAVRSAPGLGTTVALAFPVVPLPAVTLPEVAAPATPLAATPVPAGPPLAGRTLLVCDDTGPMRRSVMRLFRRTGAQLLEAENGREALERLGAHRVDLVISDLLMPEVDGFGLIDALRSQGSKVPVIVLTGYTGEALTRLDHREGVAVLAKPFATEDLMREVWRLLGLAGAPPP